MNKKIDKKARSKKRLKELKIILEERSSKKEEHSPPKSPISLYLVGLSILLLLALSYLFNHTI